MLAGLLAAIMSSIDSTLNSASTLVTMDFVKNRWSKIADERLTVIGRVVTITFMDQRRLGSYRSSGHNPLRVPSKLVGLFVPSRVAVFLLGLFWKRTSGTGALIGLVAGHLFSLGWFVLQRFTDILPPIHFLILAGVFLLVSAVVVAFASLATDPPTEEQVQNFTWSRRYVERVTQVTKPFPWYKDYRWGSLSILMLLTAWMVWTYR